VQTNIVIFHVDPTVVTVEAIVQGCAARKVKVHGFGPTSIRCVTHKDVDTDDIRRAVDALTEIATHPR